MTVPISIAALLALATLLQPATVNAQTRYESLRDSISAMRVDSSTVRAVEGLFIQDGLINLSFDSGVMAELTTVRGKRLGYVFSGVGTAMFQPDGTTEKLNLERFYNAQTFMEEFTAAVILCVDDRVSSQLEGLPTAAAPADLAEIVKDHWSSLAMQGDGTEIDGGLARSLLNDYADPHVMVKIIRKPELSAFLLHQPYEDEPYKLFIERAAPRITEPVLVNQCAGSTGELHRDLSGVHPTDLVTTEQHTLQIEFDAYLEMTARDEMYMTVRTDSLRWLDIGLYPTLNIDSIRIRRGDVVSWFRAKDGFTMWIELPRWYRRGERIELECYYRGQIMRKVRDRTILLSSILWYPAHSYRHKAFYDMTFDYPETMTLASIGSRNEYSTTSGITHARWVTGRPVRNASFHIGYFRRQNLDSEPGIPRSAILYNTAGHVDEVGLDMKQSLTFFTRLFGTLPVDSLVATELPGFHGEAFPGLLHLSHMAFDYSSWSGDDFFEEQFVAHEVAHQWWGIGVDFASYRDQWLSEGFAMYSCLLYSQLAAADANRFFTLLDRYRKEILAFGKRDVGADQAQPSIALGSRVRDGASDNDPGAYNTFVYFKGAWVLHMLRNLMLDLNTMNEDAFMQTMRTFYTSYKNRTASTADFQRTVESVVGRDMTWFFEQWVYGNKIPTYTWAWRSEQQADGTYKNQLRIKQSGVPESFMMFIPIKVTLDDGTMTRYRVQMSGGQAVMDLPSTSVEIDDVTFNEFESVLCEVDEESF